MGALRAPLPAARRAGRRRASPAGAPFRCGRSGCRVNLKSVSASWINQHAENHRYADKKEREEIKKKAAEKAKMLKAIGPSHNRKVQQKKDQAAHQRKAAKANGGGVDTNGKRAGGGKKRSRGRHG